MSTQNKGDGAANPQNNLFRLLKLKQAQQLKDVQSPGQEVTVNNEDNCERNNLEKGEATKHSKRNVARKSHIASQTRSSSSSIEHKIQMTMRSKMQEQMLKMSCEKSKCNASSNSTSEYETRERKKTHNSRLSDFNHRNKVKQARDNMSKHNFNNSNSVPYRNTENERTPDVSNFNSNSVSQKHIQSNTLISDSNDSDFDFVPHNSAKNVKKSHDRRMEHTRNTNFKNPSSSLSSNSPINDKINLKNNLKKSGSNDSASSPSPRQFNRFLDDCDDSDFVPTTGALHLKGSLVNEKNEAEYLQNRGRMEPINWSDIDSRSSSSKKRSPEKKKETYGNESKLRKLRENKPEPSVEFLNAVECSIKQGECYYVDGNLNNNQSNEGILLKIERMLQDKTENTVIITDEIMRSLTQPLIKRPHIMNIIDNPIEVVKSFHEEPTEKQSPVMQSTPTEEQSSIIESEECVSRDAIKKYLSKIRKNSKNEPTEIVKSSHEQPSEQQSPCVQSEESTSKGAIKKQFTKNPEKSKNEQIKIVKTNYKESTREQSPHVKSDNTYKDAIEKQLSKSSKQSESKQLQTEVHDTLGTLTKEEGRLKYERRQKELAAYSDDDFNFTKSPSSDSPAYVSACENGVFDNEVSKDKINSSLDSDDTSMDRSSILDNLSISKASSNSLKFESLKKKLSARSTQKSEKARAPCLPTVKANDKVRELMSKESSGIIEKENNPIEISNVTLAPKKEEWLKAKSTRYFSKDSNLDKENLKPVELKQVFKAQQSSTCVLNEITNRNRMNENHNLTNKMEESLENHFRTASDISSLSHQNISVSSGLTKDSDQNTKEEKNETKTALESCKITNEDDFLTENTSREKNISNHMDSDISFKNFEIKSASSTEKIELHDDKTEGVLNIVDVVQGIEMKNDENESASSIEDIVEKVEMKNYENESASSIEEIVEKVEIQNDEAESASITEKVVQEMKTDDNKIISPANIEQIIQEIKIKDDTSESSMDNENTAKENSVISEMNNLSLSEDDDAEDEDLQIKEPLIIEEIDSKSNSKSVTTVSHNDSFSYEDDEDDDGFDIVNVDKFPLFQCLAQKIKGVQAIQKAHASGMLEDEDSNDDISNNNKPKSMENANDDVSNKNQTKSLESSFEISEDNFSSISASVSSNLDSDSDNKKMPNYLDSKANIFENLKIDPSQLTSFNSGVDNMNSKDVSEITESVTSDEENIVTVIEKNEIPRKVVICREINEPEISEETPVAEANEYIPQFSKPIPTTGMSKKMQKMKKALGSYQRNKQSINNSESQANEGTQLENERKPHRVANNRESQQIKEEIRESEQSGNETPTTHRLRILQEIKKRNLHLSVKVNR